MKRYNRNQRDSGSGDAARKSRTSNQIRILTEIHTLYAYFFNTG
jgi:hypothetical protein